MDIQKDLQKTEGAVKFLDYQTLKSSPFGDNRVAERVYRRAERLASAVVLLTNHLDPADPLKVESRRSVIDILSNALNIRDEMRSPNSVHINNLKISVRKTISLVRLLGIGGNISFQNAEIMTEAFDELLSFLNTSRRSNLSESVSISREDLFDVRDTSRSSEDKKVERNLQDSADAKDLPATAASPSKTPDALQSSQRAQSILDVLRTQGELGIRDVASNLPEYSEKMIQRELADLVVAGRVKKTGHKRWSRYTYI